MVSCSTQQKSSHVKNCEKNVESTLTRHQFESFPKVFSRAILNPTLVVCSLEDLETLWVSNMRPWEYRFSLEWFGFRSVVRSIPRYTETPLVHPLHVLYQATLVACFTLVLPEFEQMCVIVSVLFLGTVKAACLDQLRP